MPDFPTVHATQAFARGSPLAICARGPAAQQKEEGHVPPTLHKGPHMGQIR